MYIIIADITSKTIHSPHCNDEKSSEISESTAYSSTKQNNYTEIEVHDDIIGVETGKKTIILEDDENDAGGKKKELIESNSESESDEKHIDDLINEFEKAKDNLPLDASSTTSGNHGVKRPKNKARNRKSQSPIEFLNIDAMDSMDDKTRSNNDIIDIEDGTDKDLVKHTDINNIRQVREHLLDHLLDYFINIIKEEEQNLVTRKKNNKDKMKVEDKLRNYYSPEHIDGIVYTNDTESNDIDVDYPDGRRKSDDAAEKNKDIETTTITNPMDNYNESDVLLQQTKPENPQKQEEKIEIENKKPTNKTNDNNTINNDTAVNDATIDKLPKSEEFTTPVSIITIEENSTESGEVTVSIETEIQEIETQESEKEMQQPHGIAENNIIKNLETGAIKEDSNSTENYSNSTTEAETFDNDTTTEVFDINKNSTTQDAVQNKSIDLIEDNNINNNTENIATRKKNDEDVIALNKTIIIQKKDCDDDKLEINDDSELSQRNCKKNIILQFNINM